MRILALAIAALLTGCVTTQQSPEEITALRQKAEGECRGKGYRPGTQEYQICVQSTHVQAVHGGWNAHQTAAVGAGALGLGITALMLSDARLKRDVTLIGEWRGFNLYSFRYTFSEEWHVGVMAQEVRKTRPDAVKEIGGWLHVAYWKL